MRAAFNYIFFTLLLVLAAGPNVSPAAGRQVDWMRVTSDDGEFSVEVPSTHSYFFDKEGFSLPASTTEYRLSNLHLLNSYSEGTLVGFEVYDANRGAMEKIFDTDQKQRTVADVGEFKGAGFKFKQVISRDANYYAVRRYFSSKSKIYILTTASRTGETPAMKRFLESVVFAPDPKARTADNGLWFSALKRLPVELDMKPAGAARQSVLPEPKPAPDPAAKPYIVFSKPIASYTDAARRGNVTGAIRFKVTLAEDGSIPRLAVLESLPGGLLRQAVFAAMRIRFLPKEVDGKPVTTTVMIEYKFDIY